MSIPAGILIFLAGLSVARAADPQLPSAFAPLAPKFLNLSGCRSNPDLSPACKYISGSLTDWTPDQVGIVNEALHSIREDKAGIFLQRLRELGLKEIHFVTVSNGTEQAGTLVDNGIAYIAFHPPFFSSHAKYAGVNEQKHAILHELIHAYAHLSVGTAYFNEPFWRSLAQALEWSYPLGQHFATQTSARTEAIQRYKKSRSAAQWDEAVRVDLEFSRPMGFPSLYSMSQIGEYLAELGAFLIHDPTMQADLPAPVTQFLRTTSLAFLLDPSPVARPSTSPVRFPSRNPQTEFVGMLFSDNGFQCTVLLIRHGVALTAKHCIDPSWLEPVNSLVVQAASVSYGFLSMSFERPDGDRVNVDGSSIHGIHKDAGTNDLAYILYDPKATQGKIQIPVLHIQQDRAKYCAPGVALFSVGFPLPKKIQRLEKIETRPCSCDGQIKQSTDPKYPGLLYGTTCPGWYGASGGPLLSASREEPGSYDLWGVLSHTFSAASNEAPTHVSTDDWGNFTNTNYSPVFSSVELPSLLTQP